MPDRIVLGDGLQVAPLGFGAMGLAQVYGPVDPDVALRTLHHAVDSGTDLIDTADVYGQGDNERLVGRLLADRRSEVVVATKAGIVADDAYSGMHARNDPLYLRQACEASLIRLGTDVIDLFYLHRREVAVPLEDVVGALADLVQAGKVRHLGLSEVTAAELRLATSVHPIAAVQSEWSLWSRDVERHVVPAAVALGVGFVPYSPLGRGFLTGTIDAATDLTSDWRGGLARFTGSARTANLAVVGAVRTIASAHRATPSQVALAWLRHRGESFGLGVVPIPGTRRPERIDENIASLRLTLEPEDLRVLDRLADGVRGTRSDLDDPDWVSQTRENADENGSRR